MRLSIIIPTLNEAHYLPTAIAQVRRQSVLASAPEILVADCGSVDGTPKLAEQLGTRLVQGRRPLSSRAAALNHGAVEAAGDTFLFLDADTLVPHGYDRAIRQALTDSRVLGGAFEFALDGRKWSLRLVEFLNRVRYRIWPLYYGDQGLFVRAAVFRQLGGYREQRLLEASEFCKRVQRIGKMVLLHKCMKTSARRFVEGGIYRVLANDIGIWALDLLGWNTERFGKAYQIDNFRRGRAASVSRP